MICFACVSTSQILLCRRCIRSRSEGGIDNEGMVTVLLFKYHAMVEKSYRGSSMDEDKLERLVYKVVDHPSLNQFSVCLFSSISHKSSIWSLLPSI